MPNFAHANPLNQKLDSLKQLVQTQRYAGHLANSMRTNDQIITLCKENNLKEELASAYLNAANILSNQSRFQESFDFLDLAIAIKGIKKPFPIQSIAFAEYGRNYFSLGFNELSEDHYNKGLNLNSKIKDRIIRSKLATYLYGLRAALFEAQNQHSKSLQDLHAAFSLNPDPLLSARIAKHYIEYEWNNDSAVFYLEKSTRLFDEGEFPVSQKSITLRNYGRYYLAINEYDKALDKLMASLEIFKVLEKPIDILHTYELINEVAIESKDTTLQQSALQEINRLRVSINDQKNLALEIPLHHLKNTYAKKKQE